MDAEIELIVESLVNMEKSLEYIQHLRQIDVGQNEDEQIRELIDKELNMQIDDLFIELTKFKKYTITKLDANPSLNTINNFPTNEETNNSKEIESSLPCTHTNTEYPSETIKLSDEQLTNISAKLENGEYNIHRIADALPFDNAVRLSQKLSDSKRIALMEIYRRGLSKQPGFLVKVKPIIGKDLALFLQGISSEDEAVAEIRRRYGDNDLKTMPVNVERVGVWPNEPYNEAPELLTNPS